MQDDVLESIARAMFEPFPGLVDRKRKTCLNIARRGIVAYERALGVVRPAYGITPRMQAVLDYLVAVRPYSPTLREIMAGVGMASMSNTHRLVAELERRGRIRRLPNLARTIEVVGIDDQRNPKPEV